MAPKVKPTGKMGDVDAGHRKPGAGSLALLCCGLHSKGQAASYSLPNLLAILSISKYKTLRLSMCN